MNTQFDRIVKALSRGNTPAAVAVAKPTIVDAGTSQHSRGIAQQQFEQALGQRSDPRSAEALMSAVAAASQHMLAQRWAATQAADALRSDVRRVHYLSMEFLMGRALGNAVAALQQSDAFSEQLAKHGSSLAQVIEQEQDAALGNGGLGRLAACFLDAFAASDLPSFGYGLRYQNGMFAQKISDGAQVEVPDQWLTRGSPWETQRPEVEYRVGFGGSVRTDGGIQRWLPAQVVIAQAFDFVVPGHDTQHVSTLRQWHARSASAIDFAAFCRGDHAAAGQLQMQADTLNWVLYPDDSSSAGRELRLRQEFFLVSASIQDVVARHLREGRDVSTLGRFNAVHLNDTHPALAPAELMRVLTDEHGLAWADAWRITRETTSYTNHTLMPEALECWPVWMMQALLPRHLEIIYEINREFLDGVRAAFPGDDALVRSVSLIDESGERRVRMAALAIVSSSKVNGVSKLHSQLMVDTIFADFARIDPTRFINVTNGVTHRRWLAQANPELSGVIDTQIGSSWRKNLSELSAFKAFADQSSVQHAVMAAKTSNKARLSDLVSKTIGVSIDPHSLFDVQVKRIHEYKRQLLNVMHVITRYQAIIDEPNIDWVPRTVVFSGKAASAYWMAKLIIQLIHDVGRVVNTDPRMKDRLKLVFVPNYGVSLAQIIIPAADLSEQISTAGTEASGTGNMKFALNGALTIGTWDGANIEMAQAMGDENMFVFGLRTDGVDRLRAAGYDPRLHHEENSQLKRVIDAIDQGDFSRGERDRYRPLVQSLLQRDAYLLMADYASYVSAQLDVDALYRDRAGWSQRAIVNIASMANFSADNTVRHYMQQVWAQPQRSTSSTPLA